MTTAVSSPLSQVQLHLIDSMDEVANFKRWLSTRTEIGLDIESTGLQVGVDKIRLVQFGDELDGWVVPFDRWGGVVAEVVERFEGTYNTHNGPNFDVPMLDEEDIHVPHHKVQDTRLMAHVLSSTGPLGLKPLTTMHVDRFAAVAQRTLDDAIGKTTGWTWETVPLTFEPYWIYAGLDPVLTCHLKNNLMPKVQAEAPLSYQLELAIAWVTAKMERRGVRVDREYTARFADELLRYVAEVETWCQHAYHLSPGQNQEVVRALQSDGVQFTKYTDTGAICLDKYVLGAIDHPLARAVLGRRRCQKIVSTYLSTYLELSERDGFIHPSINSVGGTAKNNFEPGGGGRGVRTGRMSSSDPNIQNVPIHTAAGARVRDAFIPREAHTWVKCDFDQIEMRLLAHLARDPGLMAAFDQGDFFVNLTRTIYDDITIVKKDDRRQLVKNGAYAKAYGAGLEKFAATAGVTVDVAGPFLRRFDEMYPGVRRMQHEIEKTAYANLQATGEAFVRSPLTRRKHVADRNRIYPLLNYLIQGTAGELLKLKGIEADEAGLTDYMLFPVHDEFDADVPNDVLSDYLDALRRVMNDDKLLAVPITASVSTGERWGSLKEEVT